jgi:thioredoxin reductase
VSTSKVDAVVIGAGPYGLATATHLRARGIDCRVFGTPMAGWTEAMPKGMCLKSTPIDSDIGVADEGYGLDDYSRSLGLEPLSPDGNPPIPIEHFVGYGLWVQQQVVPHVEDCRVERMESLDDGFLLELDTGEEVRARRVVVAAGMQPFAYVPDELTGAAGMPSREGPVSHSSHHVDLGALSGRRVAVIGAGQSAVETAVLLSEAGATVHLVARRPKLSWTGLPLAPSRNLVARLRVPNGALGPGWGNLLVTRATRAYRRLPDEYRIRGLHALFDPAAAWWLHPRLTDSIDVHMGRALRAAHVSGESVDLNLEGPDGGVEKLSVDHVIAATGYRVHLDALDFLTHRLRQGVVTYASYPRLSATCQSSVPGLYFVGLAAAATYGPAFRFVYGSRFAARRASAGVARSLRHRSPRLQAEMAVAGAS